MYEKSVACVVNVETRNVRQKFDAVALGITLEQAAKMATKAAYAWNTTAPQVGAVTVELRAKSYF